MRSDIEQLLRSSNGVIRRADHPRLARRLDRLRQIGALDSPLRGVLCVPGLTSDFSAAVRAGWLWSGPDAVITGHGAARLTFWPECVVQRLEFAIPHREAVQSGRWWKGYRTVPPNLVWHREGMSVTAPALTAVDLAAGEDRGDIIDRVLRSRKASLEQLWDALRSQPNRPGNRVRETLLKDSRDRPWSEAERLLHRLLRAAGIGGWRTNQWIPVDDDGYFADVLFRRSRLIAEVDGWAYHSGRAAFEDDRRRRNELELRGYRVLNFTWTQIVSDPEWVLTCIRRGLTSARR
jgi:very-short-patch-repair endonuclease